MTARRGNDTRTRVLEAGLELASTAGLGSVSFGALAGRSAISKSGLFAHFEDRDDLALQILDAAERTFRASVVEPALKAHAGLPRLRAMCALWLGWATRAGLGGGCPFAAAGFELDDVPGPLRDRVVATQRRWLTFLERLIRDAIESGEFVPKTDPAAAAFEMLGIYLAHHFSHRLLGDARSEAHAAAAFESLIRRNIASADSAGGSR